MADGKLSPYVNSLFQLNLKYSTPTYHMNMRRMRCPSQIKMRDIELKWELILGSLRDDIS